MACPTCGVSVLFGGVKDGSKRYCSKKCYAADEVNRRAEQIPADAVIAQANKIRDGRCPACQGTGPVDVHKSYFIYSVLVYTSYRTNEHIVCRSCARKRQLTDMLSSALLGWWGIPFGIILTPVQIIKNAIALFSNPGQSGPTELLAQRTRQLLAAQHMETAV